MGDLLHFGLPFLPAKNYSHMLLKLAGAAFFETYIITCLLSNVPAIGAIFQWAASHGSLGAVIAAIPYPAALNPAGLVIGFLVALGSHIAPLHDRISDLMRIRKRFDTRYILLPLATLVGANLSAIQQRTVASKRDQLMRAVFYRYASSRDDDPLVDKHDIERALDAWSWFWVCVEGCVYFAVAGAVAHIFHAHTLGVRFLLFSGFLAFLAFAQYPRLGRRARVEIETIAADPTASTDVRAKFNAL